ncbi:hypothetical protein MRX96_057923 [Rhipicephalus microplus]
MAGKEAFTFDPGFGCPSQQGDNSQQLAVICVVNPHEQRIVPRAVCYTSTMASLPASKRHETKANHPQT